MSIPIGNPTNLMGLPQSSHVIRISATYRTGGSSSSFANKRLMLAFIKKVRCSQFIVVLIQRPACGV